jgi:hypothetical protein
MNATSILNRMGVRVVARGEASKKKLRSKGIKPGKRGGKVTKKTPKKTVTEYFFDGELTRTETVEDKKLTVTARNLEKERIREETKEQVIADLQASAQRIKEKKGSGTPSQESLLYTTAQTAIQQHYMREQKIRESKVLSEKGREVATVRNDLNTLRNLRTNPTLEYFEETKTKREFLVRNNPRFRESLGGAGGEKAFIEADPNPPSNVKDFLIGMRANRRIYRENLSKEEFKEIKQGQFQLLKQNIFWQVTTFTGLFNATENTTTNRTPGAVLKQSVGQGLVSSQFIIPYQSYQAYQTVKAGQAVIGRFQELPPEKKILAAGGAGMVGYTVASVPANVASPMLTQTVDFGLATPTYVRSIYNPSPRNVAERNIELLDIAVDFVPEAAGVLVGASQGSRAGLKGAAMGGLGGLAVARRVPTPNVNLNVDRRLKSSGFTQVGLGSGDVFSSEYGAVTNQEQVFGGLMKLGEGSLSAVAELKLPNVNVMEQGEVGYTNSGVFANENVNVNENVNENVNANLNENVNANINQNLLINENVNANVNENVNANINENVNVNVNVNAQYNFNMNVNLPGLPKQEALSKGFSAWARVGGRFKQVGTAPTIAKAVGLGKRFVENTPAATFGVRKIGGQKFLDIEEPGFRAKDFGMGTVLIEPNRRRINTFGELSGITFKRQTKWEI